MEGDTGHSGGTDGSPLSLRDPMKGFQDTATLELDLESGGIHQLFKNSCYCFQEMVLWGTGQSHLLTFGGL